MNEANEIPVNTFEEDEWIELDKKIGHEKEVNALAGEREADKYDDIDALLSGKAPEADADTESHIKDSEEDQESDQQEEPIGVDEPEEPGAEEADDAVDDVHDDDAPDDDIKALYSKEVKMPFGMEPMTVGEMKDVVVEVNRLTADAEKTRNEAIATKEYLKDLIAIMGELPPNAQAMIRQYVDKDVTRQTQLLLEKVPEWNDNVTYTRESGELARLADEYGISNYEYQAIRDNRHIHILRDFNKSRQRTAELESRMKEMQKQLDNAKRQERSKGKKPMGKRQIQTNAQKKIAELVKAGRKHEAIDQLLRN